MSSNFLDEKTRNEDIAKQTAFVDQDKKRILSAKYYSFTERDKTKGLGLYCNASLPGSSRYAQTNLRIPEDLKKRLQLQTNASLNVSITACIQFTLDYINNNDVTIYVENSDEDE